MNDLEHLLDLRGIAPNFWNYKGENVVIPVENRTLLLSAMGVDTANPDQVQEDILEIDVMPWLKWLPALSVIKPNDYAIYINVAESDLSSKWLYLIKNNKSTIVEHAFEPGALEEVGHKEHLGIRYSKRRLPISELAIGYYDVEVSNSAETIKHRLAVTPDACYLPDWLSGSSKCSGVIVQLYSIRSNNNFGIGDFGDLRQLLGYLARAGFDSVGLNPLHALLPNLEDNCSPYSPCDRLLINGLYVSLNECDEYKRYYSNLNQQHQLELDGKVDVLRQGSHVDYEGVKTLKFSILGKMLTLLKSEDEFKSSAKKFSDFKKEADTTLVRFSLIDAIRSQHSHPSAAQLDVASNAPTISEEFNSLINLYHNAVEINLYAQWLATKQLTSVQQYALDSGMAVGIVNDLAVGADRSGSEVLTNPNIFCAKAAVGAPPDEIAPVGQNWGLPPVDPTSLKHDGYRHFISLLKANMKNCGALRIDHVMGLMRLWWCPPGADADKGAYVHYPFDDILSLLKLESQLNQCAVIGEDLGIVPENFRETLRSANVMSNKVFYFERENYAVFKHPSHYDEFALAMINNHDVPTLASWWNGDDISLRDSLNAIEVGKTADDIRKVRADEKKNVISHLVYADMLPAHWHGQPLTKPADRALIFAIIHWVAQANSKLFAIQLEDLISMTSPVNVPGTFKEYPNWKRKIQSNLEDIFSDSEITTLLTTISAKRKNL